MIYTHTKYTVDCTHLYEAYYTIGTIVNESAFKPIFLHGSSADLKHPSSILLELHLKKDDDQ